MSVWINYLAERMTLMRELGIMVIDDRGMWVDIPLSEILCEQPEPEVVPLPPPVPSDLMRTLDSVAPTDPLPEPTLLVPPEPSD
jgi:hypothetical protein